MITISAAACMALVSVSLIFVVGGLTACLIGGIMLGAALAIAERKNRE